MAVVTRYVNVASTAGGDGTTNGTAGATRAYATLSEWESNEQTDLVTDGDSHVVKCVAGTDTTQTSVDGWTAGASNTITIQADDGDEHLGVPGAGYVLQTSSAFSHALQILEEHGVMQDIEIINTAGSSYGLRNEQKYWTHSRCIFEGTLECARLGGFTGGATTSKAEACIFHNGGAKGCRVLGFKYCNFYNCLFINNTGAGLSADANGTIVARNCPGFGNTPDYDSTGTLSGSYNASEDSTEFGTNPITTDLVTGDWTAEGTEDYTIADTDSTLYNTGTATDKPSVDITGTAYTTDDLGPFGFVGAGTPTIAPADLAQAQTLDAVTITQHNVLAVADLSQVQLLDGASITQHHVLALLDLVQAQTLDNVDITQHHVLVLNESQQSQTLDNVTLTVAGVIAPADLDQAQTIDATAIVQHHVLAVAELAQAQSIDNATVSDGGTVLVVQSLDQVQLLDAADIVQHNVLVVDALTQQQILDNVTFVGAAGWLEGVAVIVSAMDGTVIITPALDGEITIN